ncbi:MAG: pre-16S rRNA-processing nuclease YqgF [Pseudanabaenaceae cyanobacterium bins.68]|nr:pre-16S rRNA-processing nuclease YqgF [Pseudanabaenaceae cyanobacterium bins.68]
MTNLLGFDPGRQKCGLAVVARDRQVLNQRVVVADQAIATLKIWQIEYQVDLLVIGDRTSSKAWQQQIRSSLPQLNLVTVDEHLSSLAARQRYWQLNPPSGLLKLLPVGMRTPPRAIDDLVAVILVERYLDQTP